MESKLSPKERMRGRIVRGVRDILCTRGRFAETVDELAAELGVAKKTIYNHFPTKAALVNAALSYDTEEWLRVIAEILDDPARGFSEKIRVVLDETLAKLQAREEMRLAGRGLADHAEEWKVSSVFRTALVEPISRLIRDGIADGYVRDDTDPRLAAYTILNMTTGAVVFAQAADVPYSPQQLLSESVWMAGRGILTETGENEVEPLHRSTNGARQP